MAHRKDRTTHRATGAAIDLIVRGHPQSVTSEKFGAMRQHVKFLRFAWPRGWEIDRSPLQPAN